MSDDGSREKKIKYELKRQNARIGIGEDKLKAEGKTLCSEYWQNSGGETEF